MQCDLAIRHAGDGLLSDESFARDAKGTGYLLRSIMLSGRESVQFVSHVELELQRTTPDDLIRRACERLGIRYTTAVGMVPLHSGYTWPSLLRGRIIEYQLITGTHPP
eukprot:5944211-Amphidinium_carterae.2